MLTPMPDSLHLILKLKCHNKDDDCNDNNDKINNGNDSKLFSLVGIFTLLLGMILCGRAQDYIALVVLPCQRLREGNKCDVT